MAQATNSQKILTYLQGNADRVVSLDELEENLQMPRNGISSALSTMLNDFPDHLTRKRQGMFIYSSEKQPVASVNGSKVVNLTVITSNAQGNFIARDEQTKVVYVVKQLEF